MIIYRNHSYKKEYREILLGKAFSHFCTINDISLQNINSEGFQIEKGPHGKPLCVFPEGLYFSVSHSGKEWICAIQKEQVGIDIELRYRQKENKLGQKRKYQDLPRYLKIAERFFSSEEQRYAKNHGLDGFMTIWVRKEAYVKFIGTGLSEGLSSFSVVADGALTEKIGQIFVADISGDTRIHGACCSPDPIEIEGMIELEITS